MILPTLLHHSKENELMSATRPVILATILAKVFVSSQFTVIGPCEACSTIMSSCKLSSIVWCLRVWDVLVKVCTYVFAFECVRVCMCDCHVCFLYS